MDTLRKMNLVKFKVLLSYIKVERFDVLKKTFIRLLHGSHGKFPLAARGKQRSKMGEPLKITDQSQFINWNNNNNNKNINSFPLQNKSRYVDVNLEVTFRGDQESAGVTKPCVFVNQLHVISGSVCYNLKAIKKDSWVGFKYTVYTVQIWCKAHSLRCTYVNKETFSCHMHTRFTILSEYNK